MPWGMVAMGAALPIYSAWLMDQLPKPGELTAEKEKKIRNIAMAITAGLAAAGLIYMFTRPKEEVPAEVVSEELIQID